SRPPGTAASRSSVAAMLTLTQRSSSAPHRLDEHRGSDNIESTRVSAHSACAPRPHGTLDPTKGQPGSSQATGFGFGNYVAMARHGEGVGRYRSPPRSWRC